MLRQVNVLKVVQANFMRTQLITNAQPVIQRALHAVELVPHNAFHVVLVSSSNLRQAPVYRIAIQINILLYLSLNSASVAIPLA